MKTVYLAVLVITFIGGGMLLGSLNAAATSSPAPACKVATCDLMKVLTKCRKTRELVALHTRRRSALKAQDVQRTRQIVKLDEQMENLTFGCEAYEKLRLEAAGLKAQNEVAMKVEIEQETAERYRLVRTVHAEAAKIVSDIAAREGIQAVLVSSGEFTGAVEQDALRQIAQCRVLFIAGGLDLTEEVLSKLDG